MKKWLPWILTGAFACWFLSTLIPKQESPWALREFGKLPVVANGRFQPIDSLARNSLLQLREKQSIYLKAEHRYLSATEWLMEVMMNPDQADDRRAFRIDHPEVKSLLKLPDNDPAQPEEDGKHYSWNQIKPGLSNIVAQAKRINDIDAAHRTPFERAVMKLYSQTSLYMRLENTLHPQDSRDFKTELADYLSVAQPGLAAFNAKQAGQKFDEEVFNKFAGYITRFNLMLRFDPPLLIPPHHPGVSGDNWMRTGEALIEVVHGHPLHYAVQAYATMASAVVQKNVESFNQAVKDYRQALAGDFAPELRKARWEYFFNQMEPFYKALILYVVAFLLACFSWFNMSEWMRRSAAYLIVLAFVIHTAGLVFRMVLEGRPPVTNLYSSAIFIGWGAVVLGMVLERFYKDGIGSVVASMVGFLTLIIAHNLALGGDTMEMMQAVLDTNFWLATHVVVVTLGYASTFVAGFLAIVYLARGLFTRTLSERTGKGLARMVYGIICFATLFSFVGTVLGGIWADQSWGRFWGWDPKENGALIIVLWNALILHARWGGMIRERGLINMAVVGNIVTSWSWFGVNMLGIGLHSYGFMDSAFKWLMLFVSSQLVLLGLGLLPRKYWLSFQERSRPAVKTPHGPLPAPQPSGK
jgi:ABC-type transport system involved in cytochrome c biogenesis permease subunit